MRRVAKRAEICVVGGDDYGLPTRREQPVELFHGADYIRHVLNDMDRAHLPECAVCKGERVLVKVRDYVGPSVGVAIYADRTWIFIDAATDVENRAQNSGIAGRQDFLFNCRIYYRSSSRRHCSSVSTAKSACSRLITSGGHRRILFGPAPKTSRPRSKASASKRSRSTGARSLVS